MTAHYKKNTTRFFGLANIFIHPEIFIVEEIHIYIYIKYVNFKE